MAALKLFSPLAPRRSQLFFPSFPSLPHPHLTHTSPPYSPSPTTAAPPSRSPTTFSPTPSNVALVSLSRPPSSNATLISMDPEVAVESTPPSAPPTVFQRFKANWGDYIAEAIGAGTIVLFGSGAALQLQLYGAGDVLTSNLGWAIGVGLGAYVAGPLSGGHINPAVTVAQAVFRRFPLRKVPGYILAQTIGCFIAAWIIYTNYSEAIDHFEPNSGRTVFGPNSTASNFISIPAPGISLWSAFHDEFLGTALLVGGIFAFTNPALPGHALAFAIFFLVLAIANGVGAQTGAAINPAREFGPRLALATLGYPVKDLFSHNSGYWFHGIWVADIVGGLVGAGLVDLFLYTGPDSIFNRAPELS